jgi:hypothetical protein
MQKAESELELIELKNLRLALPSSFGFNMPPFTVFANPV